MANLKNSLLGILATSVCLQGVDAFWRMSCGLIQTGRLDPIVTPGSISPHVHKVSGASNFGLSNTYDDLFASQCTSCEIQDDKSAYWTPQLYYQYANGSFVDVPNGGTVVYYLGRGDNRTNVEPFPPGFKMVSGDPFLRSNDTTTMTYSDSTKNIQGRLLSDRVSFACLDSSGNIPEQNYMFRTDCNNGMRAQIQFPSCWDGRDYQADQSHVAYMSRIDNGVCPPSHPRQLIHLFFEVIYGVNDINKEQGGRFVFSNGDPTGFGFHGDFINAWNATVLKDALSQCANNDSLNGQISLCPPLAKSQTPYFTTNCPERKAIVNEKVKGILDTLPGCNPVTNGPGRASVPSCANQTTPSVNTVTNSSSKMFDPVVGQKLGASAFAYVGCAADASGTRTLNGYATTSDNMTIESCTSICKTNGYPLSGLEYSKECYCGNSLGSVALTNCTSTSKMICAGNSTEWCGAPSLLTVWNDTSYVPPPVLSVGTTKINNSTATYLGCFSDPGGNNRALGGATKVDTVAMTNEMCASFCKDSGYSLAGTEYYQECFCGNSNTGTNITDISQCDAKCKGNSQEYCGGSGKMSVWSISQVQPSQSSSTQSSSTQSSSTQSKSAQPTQGASLLKAANGTASYFGCYTDGGSDGRTLSKDSYAGDTMTVDSCASYCQAKNYGLFGVEYGRECYCGYSPKTSAVLSPEKDCSMTCKGNSTQICGGSSRISIWNNTLYVPTRNLATVNNGLYAYLGCYTEGTNGRALSKGTSASSKSDSTNNSKMTVELCASYCGTKGYKYMGVEYSQECFCNNDGPINGATKASEGDCSMACSGDLTEWCGGSSRINIYKTSGT
ncbi:WSC-domain-containing protein [Whalleya microplaca]|nr:WSC-domain-containing protein [Whalleya microplaca]